MKIMVGYYGLDADSSVIAAAMTQAKAFNATVYLVKSVEIGEEVPKEEFDTAEENLKNGERLFADQGIECETHLLETGLTPGENLVEFARLNRIDELIIGVRNRSRMGKLIFGSTAQYLILNSPCPVLSVREEE